MFFLKNKKKAQQDFEAASHVPNAPAFVARLAAKSMMEYDDPKLAVFFIEGLLRKNSDPTYRAMLQDRLREAQAAAGINK